MEIEDRRAARITVLGIAKPAAVWKPQAQMVALL
jgi:hypothetical protein